MFGWYVAGSDVAYPITGCTQRNGSTQGVKKWN